ncbi:MAG: hypothetical protein WCT85_05335 [Parachlamydiales bacterium]|jgi:succinate dehydrogenase / fumarate reductase cytochrome b subunit
MKKIDLPVSFAFRRVHSLIGFFLTLFLFEHFMTNSLAAYFFNKGNFFIKMVNLLQSTPYLHFIEISLIGIPIMFHLVFGVQYILGSENNASKTDGSRPSLLYARNKAYVWQRITAVFIGVFIVFHVAQMRFINYPKKVSLNNQMFFLVKIKEDKLTNEILNNIGGIHVKKSAILSNESLLKVYNEFKLKSDEMIAMTNESGKAIFLVVRNVLKNPVMVILYTLFVISASYHALNGFWTFLISWGAIISIRYQDLARKFCFSLLLIIMFLGLLSVWSSFLY